MFGEHPHCGADLSGSAEAALQSVQAHEGLLDRRQVALARQSVDGRDRGAVGSDREGEAGDDPPAVAQHRAGTALPVVASLLRSGAAEVLPQHVEQGPAVVHRHPVRRVVDS